MIVKKLSILIAVVVFVVGIGFYFTNNKKSLQSQEQVVFTTTYQIAREYLALRYQTDNILINAKGYPSYNEWNAEITALIKKWEELESKSIILEEEANKISEQKTSFRLIPSALAYDKQELSDIFDKAPAGKKIATLAKHLGTDAKTAFRILKQDQAQVEADAWNEAGDTFRKLEVSATLVKDGCKVAGFVGGIVVTGGTSALAAGSTLAKATVIISGADMSLEVTEDMASIALGDKNKISAIVGEARKVTEPVATILAINEIPNNLKTGFDKFSSAMVAIEQFKGAAQDGKIVGIQLPSVSSDKTKFENIKKHKAPVYVSEISTKEVDEWLSSQGIKTSNLSQKDLETILGLSESKSNNAKTEQGEVAIKEAELESDELMASSSTSTNSANGLSIVSPTGKSFTPESGLNFSVLLSNPEAYITKGKNVAVWCVWKFYLNDKLYTEKINPSTIHPAVKNICEYSTLLIKDKGNLRIDFSLERNTTSKYSEEKSKTIIVQTSRKYIVK